MTSDMQAATMDRMRWGKKRAAGAQAEPPPTMNDDVGDSGFELHFCCICGALLGGDLEDEIEARAGAMTSAATVTGPRTTKRCCDGRR